MDNYTVAEIAYKNGYNQALKDFVEKLRDNYRLYGPNDTFIKIQVFNQADYIKEDLEKK